jgi:multidrug efflux system membrane fusion protein
VLYRLDDRLVRAQIKQAEAQITRDQASLKDAMSIAERRESLLQKKYASEAATETARQNVEVLRASIAAGRALLEMQRTQLDYLVIRAPITGRTGSMTAKLGAFVRSADPAALVTINQTKPINVAFALPQVALQQLKQAMAGKATGRITVPGVRPIAVEGVLTFVDNQIDRTTGTVTGKVTVENADEVLWPGLAVTVDLTVETRRGIVSLPASAVMPAQQGMIVWVIGPDRKVAVRQVVQERVIGQTAYLASGIKEGEQVVTDGQLRLVPGAEVIVREPGGGGRPAGKGRPAAGAAPSKAAVGNAGGG